MRADSMPYKEPTVQSAWSKGYRAGARRIVLAWKGSVCSTCGNTDPDSLEIAHVEPIEKPWRDVCDWLDPDNILILCTSCNQGAENRRRSET